MHKNQTDVCVKLVGVAVQGKGCCSVTQVAREKVIELGDRSLRSAVLLETEIALKVQLLFEGQKNLLDTLAPKERVGRSSRKWLRNGWLFWSLWCSLTRKGSQHWKNRDKKWLDNFQKSVQTIRKERGTFPPLTPSMNQNTRKEEI